MNLFRRLNNFGIYLLGLSLAVCGCCVALTILQESLLAIAFLILAILSFLNTLLSLKLLIVTIKKNQILKRMKPFMDCLEKFNKKAMELVELKATDDYEALFLTESQSDNLNYLLGVELVSYLNKYHFKTEDLLMRWYQEPKLIGIYIEAMNELVKEMRKLFTRIPTELKRFIDERSV